MPYNKKDIKFLRFGDLNPIKQDGYKDDTFHSAPAPKGFYAFIDFMVEPFLLGGYNPIGTKHSKRKYIKDENGNKVIIGRFYEDKNKPPVDEYDDHFEWVIFVDDEEIKRLEKRYGSKQKNLFISSGRHRDNFIYMTTMKKPKRFKYEGEIWHHHIEHVPNHLILKRNKGWVLTDFVTFVKAFNKAIISNVQWQNKWMKNDNFDGHNMRYKQFSKDDFEVFIERL
jgi:hypothetical protein